MPELIVDGHVHLHDADVGPALAGAWKRMTRARPGALPVFMLAEREGEALFESLRSRAIATSERESLWLDLGHGRTALLLAGRQIVTAEGVEVLALATSFLARDGLPLSAVIDRCRAAGAVTVLPWGVGKWLGRRGRLVDAALAGADPLLLLGDNGGRPFFWRERRFASSRVLAGSDPLPIAGSARRLGAYGSTIRATVSDAFPARDLRDALRDRSRVPRRYGRPAGLLRFLGDQLRVRLP